MTTTAQPATDATPLAAPDQDAIRAALSSGPRPSRPSALSASLTFGWRALLKIKHVPEQLFDVTLFPVMMTLLFSYLLGGALAGSPTEYLQYFTPGILVMSVVTITMYTGVAINTDIEKGVFDRIRSLPVWQPSAMVGMLLGDAIRYTISSTVILVLGVALGFRPAGGVLGVLGAVALLLVFAFAVAWVWSLFGLVLRTPQSVMGTSMMFLMPLTFGSNILVEPSTMPGWLQAAVEVNPVSMLVSAVRGLMAGTPDTSDIGWVLVISAVLVAVFGPLTMHRYRTHA